MRSTLKRVLLLPVLTLALFAASCGGGASVSAPASTGNSPTVIADSGTSPTASTDTSSPFAGIPSIPMDAPSDRVSSDANQPPPGPPPNVVILGKDFLQAQGDTVDGNAVKLESGDVTPPQGGGPNPLAYALYKVPGLGAGRPVALNIECLPGQFGQGYFVGVANYTRNKWAWFGPVTLPEFQLDLSKENHRFVTDLGNMYFIIVCPPNTAVTHSQTTVTIAPDGGQVPPGVAFGLHASDGAADHKIILDWQPGPGAVGYGIWMRPAFAGSQWNHVGDVPATHLELSPVQNNRLLFFRVQALNPNGQAEFSNVDSGYAGLRAPGDVSGVITGPNNQPIPGVPVLLAGYGEDMVRVTGPDGQFHFGDLPPSHYFVAPQGRTIDFDPPYAGGDLVSNQHVQLHFTGRPADPNGLIWGFVMTPNFNPDGSGDDLNPMPGVTVTLTKMLGPNGGDGPSITTTTDEHGFYRFPNLDGGPYRVSPSQAGINFLPPAQGVGIGPENQRERVSFIGMPPPPPGDPNNPGGGGNPPPPGGGGDPNQPNG